MAKTYILDPQAKADVYFGTPGKDTKIYMGRLAEQGAIRRVYLSGSREFVSLILGKRGSGKSYTLGTIVEGFATKSDDCSIAEHENRRAVLLLDPMGNFWTTATKVTAEGPEKVQQQYKELKDWGCEPVDVNARIWIPAGYRTQNDSRAVEDFTVAVSDLDDVDIADLIGINLIRDPQGAALGEAYDAVTKDGWSDGTNHYAPSAKFSFEDLSRYLEYVRATNTGQTHADSTLRALIRSLRALSRRPVFSGSGTRLTQLLVAGQLNVLMLPHRLGRDLRKVITRLLIKRILREREEASQIRQRLDIESLDTEERSRLENELSSRIPRSVLAIDEAQELLGDEGAEAKEALESFCLLGRNYGLSLLMATQRPTATAISTKVRSQVDLYFIHQLLTQEDIDISQRNLLSVYPEEVRCGNRDMEFVTLVRSLDRGQALITGSAESNGESFDRLAIVNIRPRVTMHGGETS